MSVIRLGPMGATSGKQRVEGLDALARAFKALPDPLKRGNARNPLNKALRSGGVVFQKEARRWVPIAAKPYRTTTDEGNAVTVRPGKLRESIRAVYVKQRARGIAGQVVVKPFGKEIRKLYGTGVGYWVPMEFGWTDPGGTRHAGFKFMRRAWASGRVKALDRIVKRLRVTMLKAAAEARKASRGR